MARVPEDQSMKPATTSNGAFDNTGAVRFDGLTLAFDPIIEMAPSDATAGLVVGPVAIGPAVEATTTGGTSFAPIVVHPIFGSSITNRVSATADPTTSVQIETAINAAINDIDTIFATSI